MLTKTEILRTVNISGVVMVSVLHGPIAAPVDVLTFVGSVTLWLLAFIAVAP